MAPPIIDFVDVTVNLADASVDRFQFGALLGVFDHSVTSNRQDGPFFSVADLNAAGFTAAATPDVNAWGNRVFAQENGIDSVIVGREDAGDANITATLDAIEAVDASSFYLLNIDDRTDAVIAEAALWAEARNARVGPPKFFVPQTASAGLLAGTPGNIGETLQAANYNRSALIYHVTDADYLDGAWSSKGGGLNLDAPAGVGIWGYQQIAGVPFDALSSTETANIKSVNANYNGRLFGLNFTDRGTAASGRFVDTQTTIDWLTVRIQEEVLRLFVATGTKIPYTQAGIVQVANAVQSVLDTGVTNGHLRPNVPPTIDIPSVQSISQSTKASRELTLTANAVLSGAIQKLILVVNLQF